MTQTYLNIIFGFVSTCNAAMLIFIIQDYLKFRFNLHQSLDERYMSTASCTRKHDNDTKMVSLQFSQLHDKIDVLHEQQRDFLQRQEELTNRLGKMVIKRRTTGK